jgi:hypothetical protein
MMRGMWRRRREQPDALSRPTITGEVCRDCGHDIGYHPGRLRVGACAICISDEDYHKITADEMCRREFPPGAQAP